MSELLNRSTAAQTIQFFYQCFRHGVLDAAEFDDSADLEEFYQKKSSDWSFGTLGYPDEMDWQAFRSQLYWWARAAGLKTFAESYLFRVRSKNHTWCVLPCAMRFYLMGIKEWIAYPNLGRIERFKGAKNIHWDPTGDIAKFTRTDIISYLHTFEFEYRRLEDDPLEIPPLAFSTFTAALYDLSQKYGTRKKKKNI